MGLPLELEMECLQKPSRISVEHFPEQINSCTLVLLLVFCFFFLAIDFGCSSSQHWLAHKSLSSLMAHRARARARVGAASDSSKLHTLLIQVFRFRRGE
ncbi:hypothetical protein ACH5RR_006626 [Cinchona calisaya]|uniref:Uncharacterized protein n=1 Tax=Cinchona calisaya TaxID=153742 RepID=A0ABD3APJ1_9GENT